MVSHGRDKKENKTPKGGRKKKRDKNNNEGENSDDVVSNMKDMDLPDDFSIFGGSCSVASSNFGDDVGSMGDFDEEEEDYDNGGGGSATDDADRAESAANNRAARLADALSLASTFMSEKRSTKREGGYRVLFKAITQYASGPR